MNQDVENQIGGYEADITKCPNCGGDADNGYDRCEPPNPYCCTKCSAGPDEKWESSSVVELVSEEYRVGGSIPSSPAIAELQRKADMADELAEALEGLLKDLHDRAKIFNDGGTIEASVGKLVRCDVALAKYRGQL